jgi:hypothetical protein
MPEINREYKIANIVLTILLISFLLVPFTVTKIDSLPFKCFVRAHTGWSCPSCGLTHSIVAIYHGDLALAQVYHPAGVIIMFVAVAELFLRLIPKLSKSAWVPWIDIGQMVFVTLFMKVLL